MRAVPYLALTALCALLAACGSETKPGDYSEDVQVSRAAFDPTQG